MWVILLSLKSQFHAPELDLDLRTKMMLDATPITYGFPQIYYEANH